jgi:hypothetical protein|tara:strand:+ start:471 stop:767 length:297 start_codon:yes stop_codon:yes gene_type:complete
MRTFRSPNSGQTSLTLQHRTSPASGYKPALGHNRDGYPTGGIPIRTGFKKGGWIQDVNKSIKKRGTKGKCTPITKKGCTGRAKALAKTFKKMAKKRKS